MIRLIVHFAVLACAALSTAVAIPVDLTPHLRVEQMIEGGTIQKIEFIHGKKTIVLCPPPGWTATGGPAAAFLMRGGTSTAQAQIRHQDKTENPTWGEESLKALREHAATFLPSGLKPTLLEEVRNPFLIENHETMTYTYSGVLQARKYKFFVMLLFLDKEQFSFLCYAEEREFPAAYDAFRTSLFRLCWKDSAS